MHKTPVAALQETATKAGYVPRYEIISQKAGTHDNLFVTRVLCNNLSADGQGSNKKTSKHNAAEAMIKLIESDVDSNMKLYLNALMLQCSVNVPTTKSVPNSPEKSSNPSCLQSDEFVNYVGKLQETCMVYNFGIPKYQDVDKHGPDHASTHTVSCTLSKLYAESSALTKKQAKQDVAKKILESLMSREHISDLVQSPSPVAPLPRDAVKEIGTSLLNLNIKSNEDIEELSQKAIVLYKSMKEKSIVDKGEVTINNFLKNSYGVPIKYESVLELEKSIKNLSPFSSKITYLIDQLEKKFSLESKLIGFPIKGPQIYVKGLRLNTTPLIIEIGRGETMDKAETEIVFKILGTLLQWSS